MAALLLGLGHETDSQTYNVGSATATRVDELIEYILSLCPKPRTDFCITNIGGHEGDTFGSLAEIKKICALGWNPRVSLKDGLQNMYKYATMDGVL
ncbi:Rossmann-fold NAD(P)-binding domain-containing protein [Helicobacter equorum]|uniref:hypothetical protein n=1 Tax=Helicobacter equorum TaxID=361872 RepID=UPI0013158A94|nr:hypothetical protein [Helicobacter equorum]